MLEQIRLFFEDAWQHLAAYPRWLVVSCAVIVGLAALWAVSKLIKFTLYVLIGVAVVAVIAGTLWWWMERI